VAAERGGDAAIISGLRRQLAEARRRDAEYRRQIVGLERVERIYRAHEQDSAERHEASPDADGVAGRMGPILLRDKNLPYIIDLINRLPFYPHLRPPGLPDAPPVGFRRAIRLARQHLWAALIVIWVAPLDTPEKVRLRHELLRWLMDDRLGLMLRDCGAGAGERDRFAQAVTHLAFGQSVPFAFRVSQETARDPVEVERRALTTSTAGVPS
jgi:hypothetical protein